jgi:hypothetical protein
MICFHQESAMSESKRIVIAGMPPHTVQRGDQRMNVFLGDNDRLQGEASAQHRFVNLGCNFMKNHERFVSILKK